MVRRTCRCSVTRMVVRSAVPSYDRAGTLHQDQFPLGGKGERGQARYVQLLVTGNEYKLLGFIPGNIHLFGIDNGFIHLFGTDASGRDIFSGLFRYLDLASGW